ncbi:MAG TPA: hypothetical protein VH413_17310 [Verrucomicrobiae bacterium]|jgi:hypothetical protein|nr:hypothetical protein [Verrucomicrobiae bacterium]
MSSRHFKIGLTVLGLCAGSAAHADTQLAVGYDTTYNANLSLSGAPGNLGTGNDFVYLTAFQATYQGGDALPFSGNSFYTFCLDVGQELVPNGASWQAKPLPVGANGNSIPYVTAGLQRAAGLYAANVGNVNISTAQGQLNGAALQLAIWNDLYDGDAQVESGNFSASGGNVDQVVAAADLLLQSAANVSNPNLDFAFWDGSNPTANQDLISTVAIAPESTLYGAGVSVIALFACAGFYLRENRKRLSV